MRTAHLRRAAGPILAVALLAACGGGSGTTTSTPTSSSPPAVSSSPSGTGTAGSSPGTPAGSGAATTRSGTFAGHYLSAVGVSSFVPCGYAATPGSGVGWWLTADPASGFTTRYAALRPQASAAGAASSPAVVDQGVYVRFQGTLRQGDPAGYGQGHTYRGQVQVRTVLEMSARGRCPGMQGAPPS